MKRVLGLTIGFALFGAGAVHAQGTLDAVQKKGFVQCGVSTGLAGFSQPDSQGVWKGLDVDMCRAVAAAGSTRNGSSCAAFLISSGVLSNATMARSARLPLPSLPEHEIWIY